MYTFYLWFYPVMAAILGLFIGSFLNVLIYRLPLMLYAQSNADADGVNLWWPPSHCPECGVPVWRRDNIPVLSWLWLKGKCRHCHCAISARYLISELVCGLVFTLLTILAWPQYNEIQIASFCLFFCLLYSLSAIDFKHLLLPDTLVFLLLWSGLACSVTGIIDIKPRSAIYGVIVAWLLIYSVMALYAKIRGREGLGNGDVKLIAAISAWLGVEQLPALIILSSVFGIILYLFFLRSNMRRSIDEDNSDSPTSYIPFGPAISLSAMVIFYTGLY